MISNSVHPTSIVAYLRGHKRAVKEGIRLPWKQPFRTVMTVLTLAVCFYIPLFLWTVWLNYDELKHSWQNQGTIAVFLHGNLDDQEVENLLKDINQNEIISDAKLLSEDAVKQQLNTDEQLSQFTKLIKSYDLPRQVSIQINDSAEVDTIEELVNTLEINPQIEYVSYDRQWLSQLQGLTSTLLQMSRVSAVLFLAIIMVILGNTISNEISEHKQELRLLELIGASNAQVRRSFLYLGVFLGIYAAILAVMFLFVSFWWLSDLTNSLFTNFGVDITLHGLNILQIVFVVFLSVFVTWLSARVSLTGQKLYQLID